MAHRRLLLSLVRRKQELDETNPPNVDTTTTEKQRFMLYELFISGIRSKRDASEALMDTMMVVDDVSPIGSRPPPR
jgi:hypothetical protein